MSSGTLTIGVGTEAVNPRENNVSRKKPGSQEPPVERSETFSTRLKGRLLRAFKAYLTQSRPRVTPAAALETAIEDFLRTHGYLNGEQNHE